MFFYAYFILKLDEPFINEEIFIISLFFKVQILVLGVKKFFFFAVFYSGSVDPHIFWDSDPKHCFKDTFFLKTLTGFYINQTRPYLHFVQVRMQMEGRRRLEGLPVRVHGVKDALSQVTRTTSYI